MKLTKWSVAACGAVLVVAGCQTQKDTTPRMLDIVPSVDETNTMDVQPIVNDTRLTATSPPVRLAFLHDFPSVGITGITTLNTRTGEVLYRITFIWQGTADSVTYNDSGVIVQRPTMVAPVPADVTIPPGP